MRRSVQTAGDVGHRAAAVGPDESDVGKARNRAAREHAQNGARGIDHELDSAILAVFERGLAGARGAERMAIDHGLAPVQLLHQRGEQWVSEIVPLVARKHAGAIGVKRVERVFELLERALHVGQRQRGEEAKAPGVIADHFRREFIALARQASRLAVIAEPHARVADRQDRGGDVAFAHLVERFLRRPVEQRLLAGLGDFGAHRGHGEVVMRIDAEGAGRAGIALRPQGAGRQQRGATERPESFQKAAPRGIVSGAAHRLVSVSVCLRQGQSPSGHDNMQALIERTAQQRLYLVAKALGVGLREVVLEVLPGLPNLDHRQVIDARGFAQDLKAHRTFFLAAVGGELLQHLGAGGGGRGPQQVHMRDYIKLLAGLLRRHGSPPAGEQGRTYQKKSFHRRLSYRVTRGDATRDSHSRPLAAESV